MATAAQDRGTAAPGGAWALVGHVIRHPVAGWPAAAASPAGRAAMLVGVALPLTAIGPVARMAHAALFGTRRMGIIDYRPSADGAVEVALVGWLAAWAAAALLVLVVQAAAPRFGGKRDAGAAARAGVLGGTVWWLAGAFAVLPHFLWLQAVGAGSLVLLFVGAPVVMRVPAEREAGFGALVAGAAALLAAASLALPLWPAKTALRPTVATAHGREVVRDTPAIAGERLVAPEAGPKKAPTPGQRIAASQGAADPDRLESLLPATIGAFRRTALVAQSNLSAGAASADAKGTYVSGTDSLTLTITDSGAPGALATNDSVIPGQVNQASDRGYRRSVLVNGVRVTEKWTYASHGGAYSRTVGGRFTLEAQGTAPSIDALRAAVGAVDQTRLRGMAP